jgi:hypothetical protein
LFPTDKTLLRIPGSWHDSIAGCLVSAEPPKRICGPTLLDAGAPGINISSANWPDLWGWMAADYSKGSMEIAFKNESNAESQH